METLVVEFESVFIFYSDYDISYNCSNYSIYVANSLIDKDSIETKILHLFMLGVF